MGDSNSRCAQFTWIASDRSCHLSEHFDELQPHPGALSGPAHCGNLLPLRRYVSRPDSISSSLFNGRTWARFGLLAFAVSTIILVSTGGMRVLAAELSVRAISRSELQPLDVELVDDSDME